LQLQKKYFAHSHTAGMMSSRGAIRMKRDAQEYRRKQALSALRGGRDVELVAQDYGMSSAWAYRILREDSKARKAKLTAKRAGK
jgi:transposase